jgi:type VI secretion system protein VasD
MSRLLPRRTLRPLGLLLAICHAAGCGVAQSVHDGTVSAAQWAFTTQVSRMNLDLTNRSTEAAAPPAVIRIYQLTSSQAFIALSDAQWLANDQPALKADLLAESDVVVRPGASASLNTAMHEQTRYVAIVALVPHDKPVRLLIPKKQWTRTDPVNVELADKVLRLAASKNPTGHH